tara:strand:+ start:12524 stop:13345 length:822 start_codon:yes stop_codon:yes gene_type:complete
MSSIYRKGRDGYFYYQTYSQDPLTQKKDKKIYHSLGTKERSIAEKKKIELDNFYAKEFQKSLSNGARLLLVRRVLFTGLVIFLIYIGYSSYDFNSKRSKKFHQNNEVLPSEYKSLFSGKTQKEVETEDVIEKLTMTTPNTDVYLKKDSAKENSRISQNNLDKIKNVKFEYEIKKVDLIDGSFKQGKIHVVVNEKYGDEHMVELCKMIKNHHSEFSNIIICVYFNSESGIELSMGKGNSLTAKEISDSWLAMYSFNNVEGEYFDNSPAVYLGDF